jgi:hypothetical protein
VIDSRINRTDLGKGKSSQQRERDQRGPDLKKRREARLMQEIKQEKKREDKVSRRASGLCTQQPIPSSGSPQNSVVGSMRKGGAMFRKAEKPAKMQGGVMMNIKVK